MNNADVVPRDLVPYLLGRASRSVDRAWLASLRDHGVTIAQWQVLAILREYDGARVGQLARMSGTEQPVASRVVDQMERDGLVRRAPAPDDRRAVEIWLTRSGRALFTRLHPSAGELVARATEGLDDAAVRDLTAALTVVIANLEGPAPPLPDSVRSVAGEV
jgi:MarR family transcriptional regulator, transcriptional regulator for hemolysin